MAHRIDFFVDGGCRRNGHDDAVGAAAACMMSPDRQFVSSRAEILNTDEHRATNARAEIQAVIMALEWAQDTHDRLDESDRLDITIHSDSRYALGCLGDQADWWAYNGWINSRGMPVANADLIEEASHLENIVRGFGDITYVHIPREENVDADRVCNEILDDFEDGPSSRYEPHEEDHVSSDEDDESSDEGFDEESDENCESSNENYESSNENCDSSDNCNPSENCDPSDENVESYEDDYGSYEDDNDYDAYGDYDDYDDDYDISDGDWD